MARLSTNNTLRLRKSPCRLTLPTDGLSYVDQLLADFDLYMTAQDISGQSAQQSLPNRNGSDVVTMGYARGAEIVADGLHLPGTAGNDAGITILPVVSPTTVKLTFNGTYSDPGQNQIMMGSNNARVDIRVNTNGNLTAYVHLDGIQQNIGAIGSGTVGVVDGDDWVVSVFYDTVTGLRIYTWSINGGPTVTSSNTYASLAGQSFTSEIYEWYVGARATNQLPYLGTAYSAVIEVDGAVVASPDFASAPIGAPSFVDAQGNVWTVDSTGVDTSDPALLTMPNLIRCNGTLAHLQTEFTPDIQLASGAVSVFMDVTMPPGVSNGIRFCSSESGSVNGLLLFASAVGVLSLSVRDGAVGPTMNISSSDYRDGERFQMACTFNGNTGRMSSATSRGHFVEGSMGGSLGPVTHDTVRFMKRRYSDNAMEGDVFQAAITSQALTETELRALVGI